MFPNPQDALPLPPRPSLEHYRKLAKELVKACRTGERLAEGSVAAASKAVREWIARFMAAPLDSLQLPDTRRDARARSWTEKLASFVVRTMSGPDNCTLTKAQFVIARAHGFLGWPKFSKHIEQLVATKSAVSQFEAAADAIANGDTAKLKRLLRENPHLVHTRSTREHGATLLHYISANGVENYRQKTPKNIVEIAALLLDTGADVNATCEVYGGAATALGLTATSVHPANAGVMNDLLGLLLDRGAYIDKEGSAGRAHCLVFACLANGQPSAARYLASKGAPVDFVSAAALDRIEEVQKRFMPDGSRKRDVSKESMQEAYRYACGYGATRVVEFLLEHGADMAEHTGDGYTGTHYAVMYSNVETVKLLLRHKPPLEGKTTHGGSVLFHALWAAARGAKPDAHAQIVEALLAAGAKIPETHPPVNADIDALLERYGSRADPNWRWGED
jgi:ankyrin repeat protein